jgi:SNF2 family DNA or RNA helicase
MIKGHYTKRWKKMQELRELCNAHSGLTGTPFANTLFDAYTQLEWLGKGLSGFTSFKTFKSYYGKFVRRNDSPHQEILTGYKNLPILHERIARLCFIIDRKKALPELPEKTYDVLEVEMTKFQRDCYVRLQNQLMIEIENELKSDGNKQLTANHILTRLLRLSQITSGYLRWDAQYNDEGEITNQDVLYEEILPSPKIDAVVELLKSKAPTDKTIIWTNWVAVIKMLSKRLTQEGIKFVTYYGATKDDDRQKAQDSYNMDPNVKVFIGNPAAGGVGLDLWGHIPEWDGTDKDHGCNTTQELYFSQNWSMIHRSQSEDRPVRRGTRVSVQVTDVVVPGTIDEEIAARVLNKQITALHLQDVRDILHRLLSKRPDVGDDNL